MVINFLSRSRKIARTLKQRNMNTSYAALMFRDLRQSLMLCYAEIRRKLAISAPSGHLHTEKIAKAYLGDVVADVFVVIQISPRNAGILGRARCIRLRTKSVTHSDISTACLLS